MDYDVLIIGGGVSGTALLYTLTNFTDIKRVALLEKHADVAQVSSHTTQNSQTLHFGDIESNYSYEKAVKVSQVTEVLRGYIETVGKHDGAFVKKHKMLLAVGDDEVARLKERYAQFRKLFPKNKLLDRKGIAQYEPAVVKGRGKQRVAAIWSPDGYIMDYHALARSFLKRSRRSGRTADVLLNTEVRHIEKASHGYIVATTDGKAYTARAIVVDAGGMSIRFAKMLGVGKHLTILSLGGDFYRGPERLRGKVYTMQHPKRPNAAIHGDPDVHHGGYTRYGPTAKVLLQLERRNGRSVKHYFASFNWSPRGILAVLKTGLDPAYLFYILENYAFELPLLGKRLLARHVRKIVPLTKASELRKDKGYGAARPQIIDARTLSVNFGEARLEAGNAIFNITPSPGASTCLGNAVRDAEQVCGWLGARFEKDAFKKVTSPRRIRSA